MRSTGSRLLVAAAAAAGSSALLRPRGAATAAAAGGLRAAASTSATTQRVGIWLAQSAMHTSRRTLYSALVEDHYAHPRNVGKLDKNDPHVGTGLRGAPECGDMTQMQVKINPDTLVIEDVKFKAFGCGSAIAASSYASQAIRGKTLADALQLTNRQIAQELSLPPVKLHCSMLAEETIHAAVENYLSKNPTLKSKVKRGGQASSSTTAPDARAAVATATTTTSAPNGSAASSSDGSNTAP